jgi:hypothetical protein
MCLKTTGDHWERTRLCSCLCPQYTLSSHCRLNHSSRLCPINVEGLHERAHTLHTLDATLSRSSHTTLPRTQP